MRGIGRIVGAAWSRTWAPHSRLFLVGEASGWVIDEELRAIARIASELEIQAPRRWPAGAAVQQSVFYGSHFALFADWPASGTRHRIATTYFHGLPGTPGMPEFDSAFETLRRRHHELDRVQVSHRELEGLVLSSGIEPGKVFRIPIGVDLSLFSPSTAEARSAAKRALGLPQTAFVLGSFQKDGVGWGEGSEPKLIKGPDVLVETAVRLFCEVPELHVLLSGPARGYVTRELEARGVPHSHRVLDSYREIGGMYAAADAYVVAARQEGGPKGVLESMAAGVPLVSTRVGQATDLIRDGQNGWLVEVEDVDALVDRLARIAGGTVDVEAITRAGLVTAAANSYDAQLPLWRAFFDGFVEST